MVNFFYPKQASRGGMVFESPREHLKK